MNAPTLAPDFRNAFALPWQASRVQDEIAAHMKAAAQREQPVPCPPPAPKGRRAPRNRAVERKKSDQPQAQLVLRVLRVVGRGTADEVAAAASLPPHSVKNALFNLKQAGLAIGIGKVGCVKIWEAAA